MKYSKEKENEIIKLHSEGKSPFEIAKILGTYNTTIRRVLLRNNIILKDQSEAQTSVTTNPFENYQTDEKAAYWLGYLIADGCVSNNKGGFRVIINTNKDPEHLQKYGDYIGKPVRKYWNKTYEVWEYSVVFYNKRIVNWLIDLGITPRKSLTFNFKDELNNHIIRGIFDGDGHKHKDYLSITTASEVFANRLYDLFFSLDLSPSIYLDRRGSRCYNVVMKNKEKAIKYLIKDATICIYRKLGS